MTKHITDTTKYKTMYLHGTTHLHNTVLLLMLINNQSKYSEHIAKMHEFTRTRANIQNFTVMQKEKYTTIIMSKKI